MGPDQGLYAYVGGRILHGELAYRDAWDQKPPGIHYVYAALRAVSSRDAIVPAADLIAAAGVAALLWTIGTRLCGPLAGGLSALLFLFLSDPSLARYAGVRVRAQGETFIALAVTGAVALAVGARGAASARRLIGIGLLIGVAFAIKYNAGLYVLIVLMGLAVAGTEDPAYGVKGTVRSALLVALGAAIVPAVLFVIFWRGGALGDLYQATIAYNVRYSGETYASRWEMLRYLFIGPVRHARVDPLWFVGGIGCVVLLVAGVRALAARQFVSGWIPVAWVAVACLSIAINGSRDLPQYFLQAAPALGLAAGMGAAITLPRLPVAGRWIVIVVLAAATWRVGADPFPKLAENICHDAQYAIGRMDRRTHLAKYGTREIDKYTALGNLDVGTFLGSHTRPDERVYIFGFSPGAYVYADRPSASRFFWSRPVILEFNSGDPRYGVPGLRAELERTRPAFVVLQMHDWSPDVEDSGPFFHAQPALDGWLRAHYRRVEPFVDGFEAWERNDR